MTTMTTETTGTTHRPFAVGDRVRYASEEEQRETLAGQRAYVTARDTTRTGTVTRLQDSFVQAESGPQRAVVFVRWDDTANESDNWPFWLRHLDAETTAATVLRVCTGAADKPRTGERVRITQGTQVHEGTVVEPEYPHRDAGFRVNPVPSPPIAGSFGNTIPGCWRHQDGIRVEVIGATPAGPVATPATQPEPEPEFVDPLPVGSTVQVGAHQMRVVSKSDQNFLTCYGWRDVQSMNAVYRSDQYVALRNDHGGYDLRQVSQVSEPVDISGLSDAQRLRALQVMIHRVASYEAVRRSWCNEVNGALAALGDLLPEDLREVDRVLGSRLSARDLFTIEGITDTPITVPGATTPEVEYDTSDVEYTAMATVTYVASEGYTVSDAHVAVHFSVNMEVDEDGDPISEDFDPRDYIDEYGVEAGIDNSDLPGISRAADVQGFAVDTMSVSRCYDC